jgi:ATP-binding cassette subfamily B protein
MPTDGGLRRLWSYTRAHRPKVVIATIYTTLGKVMDVVPEVLIGVVIDVIVRGQQSFMATIFGIEDRWNQLLVLAGVNLVVWILESLFGYLSAVAWRNLSQTIEHEIRTDLYSHVQSLEIGWFDEQRGGGLLSILNDDINQLERFLDVGAALLITLFWNVILVGAVFAASSLLVTTLAFLPIPIIVIGSIVYQRRLEPRYAKVRESVAELSATISTNLGGISTIKAFSAEEGEADRLKKVSNDYRIANRDAIRYSAAFVPLIRMAILAGFTCTLVVGGWLALEGRMEIGVYSVLVFMTQRLLWPLTSLGETLDQYQRAMASTRRIFGLLDTKPEMQEGGTAPETLPASITFSNVNFSYNGDLPTLSDISITIPDGKTHAIVGSTGSGKTTMVKLLLRFYDPNSGQIDIGGLNIKSLRYAALRKLMGYVSQDVFLFHGTVRENIAYGKPEASAAQIEQAAKLAEAHDFIMELPQGYDTVIGERGQKLSGGQRQRLSLARAIIRDPKILVLDEATSAVDNETEAAIQRSLAQVTKNRTAVVIAHRLSTVRSADRIWVLERGRIVESGTHNDLVARGGLYAALWRVQTGAVDGAAQ